MCSSEKIRTTRQNYTLLFFHRLWIHPTFDIFYNYNYSNRSVFASSFSHATHSLRDLVCTFSHPTNSFLHPTHSFSHPTHSLRDLVCIFSHPTHSFLHPTHSFSHPTHSLRILVCMYILAPYTLICWSLSCSLWESSDTHFECLFTMRWVGSLKW